VQTGQLAGEGSGPFRAAVPLVLFDMASRSAYQRI
jgi:hypothetical protein